MATTAMKTRIPEVLERHEAEILSDWMKEQATALTQRPDLMKESELRQESTKFLKLFREAIAGNNLIDIQQSIWEPVRAFIGDVSRSRAIQGFSPSETATFVLSLKQPLFTRLRKIHEGQPDYLFEDLWNVTVLLDKLGLYSVENFQKTREDVIGRQQKEMFELSTPVVELWQGILGLPIIGTLDSKRSQQVMEIESGLPEIAALMKPVFYQDNVHTLFVQPNVVERTIESWQEWVTNIPEPDSAWREPEQWREIVVLPEIPRKEEIIFTRDAGFQIDRASLVNSIPDRDWLLNGGTGVLFDGELIGPSGRAGLAVLPSTEVAGAMAQGAKPLNIHPDGGLGAGSAVVLTGAATLEQTGLIRPAGGLNVIGSGGLNSGLMENFNALDRGGAGNVGPGFGGR